MTVERPDVSTAGAIGALFEAVDQGRLEDALRQLEPIAQALRGGAGPTPNESTCDVYPYFVERFSDLARHLFAAGRFREGSWALDGALALVRRHPLRAEDFRVCLELAGSCMTMGRFQDIVELLTELERAMSPPSPHPDADRQLRRGVCLSTLGLGLALAGRADEARGRARAALDVLEGLYRPRQQDVGICRALAYMALALAADGANRPTEAIEAYRSLLAGLDASEAATPNPLFIGSMRMGATLGLAGDYLRLGRVALARDAAEQYLEAVERAMQGLKQSVVALEGDLEPTGSLARLEVLMMAHQLPYWVAMVSCLLSRIYEEQHFSEKATWMTGRLIEFGRSAREGGPLLPGMDQSLCLLIARACFADHRFEEALGELQTLEQPGPYGAHPLTYGSGVLAFRARILKADCERSMGRAAEAQATIRAAAGVIRKLRSLVVRREDTGVLELEVALAASRAALCHSRRDVRRAVRHLQDGVARVERLRQALSRPADRLALMKGHAGVYKVQAAPRHHVPRHGRLLVEGHRGSRSVRPRGAGRGRGLRPFRRPDSGLRRRAGP